MSQEEINRLSDEEAELLRKIEELRQKKAVLIRSEAERKQAEERAREIARPIDIKILTREGGNLVIKAGSRVDLLEVWRSVQGRYFRAPDMNLIPIKEWEACFEKLQKLPNITISWEKGAKDELDWYLSAPPWLVSLEHRRNAINIIAKPGPEQPRHVWGFNDIPGSSWDYEALDWTFPQSEAWRVFQELEKLQIQGIVYTPEAHALILEQIEKRASLDKIAQKVLSGQPSEKFYDLNGFALRGFQGHAIEFLEATDGRALVAAQTGLGKTWISIGYLEELRKKKPDSVFVIAVKSANIPNWEREIKRLTGTTAFVCSNYHKVPIQAMKELQFNRGKKHNYFIISHDTLGSYEETQVPGQTEPERTYMWQMYFIMAQIDALVIDEAHQIKNPSTHRFRAARPLSLTVPHRILLTATPVLNRTSELWTLLHMLDPIMFSSYDKFIERYTLDGKTPANVEKLHELLRPVSLRIKKSDVLKDLPPINRIDKVFELDEEAKVRYDDALVNGLYHVLKTFDPYASDAETKAISSILPQFTRLKQICADAMIPNTVEEAQNIIDEANGDLKGGKVLIFSQYLGSAYNIARQLGSEAVCTVSFTNDPNQPYKSANSTERDRLFEEARHDSRIKYIVTTEAAKEGHNLEFCNWVIFNDQFWTPAGHEQAEGRAYGRLSDPHPIDSIYMRMNTTIIEFIFDLLIRKMEINDATVDSVEMTRDMTGSILVELIKKIKESMWEGK